MFSDKKFIDNYFRYFGYAFLEKPEDVIPNVTVIILYISSYGYARILFYPGFCLASLSSLYRDTLQETDGFSGLPSVQYRFLMLQANWDGFLQKWDVSHG